MKDAFISYNHHDRAWAEWIAWVLEEAAYTVVIQAWDFRPGQNFILQMQRAAAETLRTLVVLSDRYLAAEYTQPEWAAALAEDPRGEKRKLIPFRIAPCRPEGLLKALIYADLVGLDEAEAEAVVLGALAERGKPPQRPTFPGHEAYRGVPLGASQRVPFPVQDWTEEAPEPVSPPAQPRPKHEKAAALWREKLDFLREQEVQATDPEQRFALEKQIERAQRKIDELS